MGNVSDLVMNVFANVKIESRFSFEGIVLGIFFREEINYQIRELCLINLAVKNYNVTGKGVTHGNIDEKKLQNNIQTIKNFMSTAPPKQ